MTNAAACSPRPSSSARAEDRHNAAHEQIPSRHLRIQTPKRRRLAIEAHYPGAEIRYINGLKSKVEVDEWSMTTIGYARVITTDQDLDIQIAALKREGCATIPGRAKL